MPYHLRFFFECGVDTPLWPGPSGDPQLLDSPCGYPCELDRLPIPLDTQNELAGLAEWYQSSLDWDYPPDPPPWPKEERELFTRQADAALEIPRRESGDNWAVEDQHQPW
ncbi:hypothetical protein ACK03K_17475 [[Kitasatospora] papulosa]|uniref:hypothetical protein n=1 Tax=[Kitasatospora] papulosa TaxID=1464011 RepID=UPI0039083FB2